jgi:thioredoxin reductase
VGGSVAGLSAALILGRSLRNVLVIDSGEPCNRQTPHSHSFMTRDGVAPHQLTALAREQALAYPTVAFLSDTVTVISQETGGFRVTTEHRQQFTARKILLATGVYDIMPAIEGFAECWGRSVLHCPYCHGYEVKNEPLGVMINGDHADEYTGLIRHWSNKLTLFTDGPATLNDTQRATIQSLGVPLVETPLVGIDHQNGMMTAVQLQDGNQIALSALFAPVPTRQHSELAQQLGCDLTPTGLIAVSAFGETNVPGVFAAGDNSSPMRQLVVASAAGSTAGAFLNRALVNETITEIQKYSGQ